MKAKQLADLLLQHPDATVVFRGFLDEDDATDADFYFSEGVWKIHSPFTEEGTDIE